MLIKRQVLVSACQQYVKEAVNACKSKFSSLQMRRVRIFFIGIGGAGMGGIAEVLFNEGYGIAGSDIAENASQQAKDAGRRYYDWPCL